MITKNGRRAYRAIRERAAAANRICWNVPPTAVGRISRIHTPRRPFVRFSLLFFQKEKWYGIYDVPAAWVSQEKWKQKLLSQSSSAAERPRRDTSAQKFTPKMKNRTQSGCKTLRKTTFPPERCSSISLRLLLVFSQATASTVRHYMNNIAKTPRAYECAISRLIFLMLG